jgi:hypothetical protein
MKHTALLLLLGPALLPHAVLAGQAPVSVCVGALEQLEALKTVAPVYKITRSQERQYLAEVDRPAEIARLETIVAGSCSSWNGSHPPCPPMGEVNVGALRLDGEVILFRSER